MTYVERDISNTNKLGCMHLGPKDYIRIKSITLYAVTYDTIGGTSIE